MQASNGDLYGLALLGGAGSAGTVFRAPTSGAAITSVHDFSYSNFTNGCFPWGALIQASDGNLYGQAERGGTVDYGVLFSMHLDGSAFTKVHEFSGGANGALPVGLLEDAPGHLIGLGKIGGSAGKGIFFEVDLNGGNYAVLQSVTANTDIFGLQQMFIQTSTGDLLGSSFSGGQNGRGFIYKVSTSNAFSLLKEFPDDSPSNYNNLIQVPNGDLYGTSAGGGGNGGGAVFKITPTTGTYTKLYDFAGANDHAVSSLVYGTNGALYGVTSGNNLYKINLNATSLSSTIVIDNRFKDLKGIIQSTGGPLFGFSKSGVNDLINNVYNGGWIYRIDPDGNNLTPVISFGSGSMGAGPKNLLQASDGNLYGINESGKIFKVGTDGSNFSVIHDTGVYSSTLYENNLVEGTDGYLYGMFETGGTPGRGFLFKVQKNGNNYTILVNFDPAVNGGDPYGGVVLGPDGYLYGTTSTGGTYFQGTIFKVKTDGTGFTTLVQFDRQKGANTYSRLQVEIIKSNQTITFGTLASKKFGDASFSLTATSDSGLPVAFTSSDPSTAEVSGSTITIKKAGTAVITASQAGNSSYYPAADITQTLTIGKADQTITFGALTAKLPTDQPFTLNATSTSGLAIAYSSSNAQVATVSGNTVTIVGAGTTTITASQAGNANYNAATSVQQSLSVASVTGLEDEISFSLYPNPVKEELMVDLPISRSGTEIVIFNVNGKRMENMVSAAKTLTIDVRHYPAGLYLLQLTQDKKKVSVKFVKE